VVVLMTERTGYLTAAELQAVQHLHKRAPYSITGVSRSMFSVARHYGGMTHNGCQYLYVPPHDELVRADVFKVVGKLRREKAKP
jgi:hypothetical protein